jgi:antitoxin MazE
MEVRVSKWGNSLAVRLPKELAERLALHEGETVEILAVDDGLTLRKVTPIPRYRLEDLLAEMEPANQPPLEDWGPDVGAEVIDDEHSRGGTNGR